ncbi:hypothetical protein VP01_155g2 [Puccinia sorghi]|uniref:Uncharacterized protein n=1 Tax=Puccinia sorghi TaxID=27349 RepID=A0A0L6VI25_9BASI|nr:hypothetical protein VP01_155g2 [Puccinia sorghi]
MMRLTTKSSSSSISMSSKCLQCIIDSKKRKAALLHPSPTVGAQLMPGRLRVHNPSHSTPNSRKEIEKLHHQTFTLPPSAAPNDTAPLEPSVEPWPASTSAPAFGSGLLRLYKFFDQLSQVGKLEEPMSFLQQLVAEYFIDSAVFKISLWDSNSGTNKAFGWSSDSYINAGNKIPVASLARFFHVFFDAGATSMTTSLENPAEMLLVVPITHQHPETLVRTMIGSKHLGYALECESCTWSIKYKEGVKVDMVGKLSANMYKCGGLGGSAGEGGAMRSSGLDVLKMDSFEYIGNSHVEWICRNSITAETIERVLAKNELGAATAVDGSSGTTDAANAASLPAPSPPTPVQGKASLKGRRQSAASARKKSVAAAAAAAEEDRIKSEAAADKHSLRTVKWETNTLPISPVGTFGIPEKSMRCLELIEGVAQLAPLMMFSVENNLPPLGKWRWKGYTASLQEFTEQFHRRTMSMGPAVEGPGAGGRAQEAMGQPTGGSPSGSQTSRAEEHKRSLTYGEQPPNGECFPADEQHGKPVAGNGTGTGSNLGYFIGGRNCEGLPPIVPPVSSSSTNNNNNNKASGTSSRDEHHNNNNNHPDAATSKTHHHNHPHHNHHPSDPSPLLDPAPVPPTTTSSTSNSRDCSSNNVKKRRASDSESLEVLFMNHSSGSPNATTSHIVSSSSTAVLPDSHSFDLQPDSSSSSHHNNPLAKNARARLASKSGSA